MNTAMSTRGISKRAALNPPSPFRRSAAPFRKFQLKRAGIQFCYSKHPIHSAHSSARTSRGAKLLWYRLLQKSGYAYSAFLCQVCVSHTCTAFYETCFHSVVSGGVSLRSWLHTFAVRNLLACCSCGSRSQFKKRLFWPCGLFLILIFFKCFF